MLLVLVTMMTAAAAEDSGGYHNQFAVHVPGGRDVADTVAQEHGLQLVDTIGALDDHYLLEAPHLKKRLDVIENNFSEGSQ